MDRNLIGMLVFFIAGCCLYGMVRYTKPWPDKYQNFFWLIVLSPLALTLFVLSGNVDPNLINAIHSLIAGLAFCEYIRTKQADKIAKLKRFGSEVNAHRQPPNKSNTPVVKRDKPRKPKQ